MIQKPWFRYLLPFILWMVITSFQTEDNSTLNFQLYALKTVLVGASLVYLFKGRLSEISGKFDLKAVLVGLIALAVWLIPDLWQEKSASTSFNPEAVENQSLRITGILFRILGASLIVPFVEELLWRSYLMRVLIKEEFLKVELGTYTHMSFWVTVIAFTSVHRPFEWPLAITVGLLYGGYLVKTKNLWGCIIAHGVTNL